MGGHRFVREQLFAELSQRTALNEALLYEIVRSKRLLADHIDVLDLCYSLSAEHIQDTHATEQFTFVRAAAISTCAAICVRAISQNAIRCIVPLAAGAYGIGYAVKSINRFKCARIKRRLNGILADIDAIDSAIRRNISYFREMDVLKVEGSPAKGNRMNQRVQDCVRCVLDVVRVIYDDVKRLEAIELPPKIAELYEPLGDIDDCIYFKHDNDHYGVSDIKDIFNIFLLFQSQLLLRLYLVILYCSSDGVGYLMRSTSSTRHRMCECIEALTGWLKPIRATNQSGRTIDRHSTDSLDVSKIKRASMDVYSRLLAALNRYEQVDDTVQHLDSERLRSEVEMVALLGEMSQIKETLCACHDDHQRVMLIFNKVLAQMHNLPTPLADQSDKAADEAEHLDEQPDRPANDSISDGADDECKEFFALNEIKDDSDDERAKIESRKQRRADDLETYDVQVTRSLYAPVLKQLKSKIDPINADMREREMKFLLAKGIDREQILNFDSDASEASDASGSSGPTSGGQRKRHASHQDRYAGMRTLLENKQQFCFLPANLPTSPPAEDILE